MLQPIYICRMIDLSITKYYSEVLFPILLKSTVFFVVFWMSLKGFIMPSYFNLIILISITCILFIGTIFFVGFDNLERDYFKGLIFTDKKSVLEG